MSVVRIEISPKSIAWILAAAAGVWLAWKLWDAELVLVGALILAGTFTPVVEWLERRRMRRGLALFLLLVALLVVVAVLLLLMVPPLSEQLLQIVKDAPATRMRLIATLTPHPMATPLTDAVRSAELKHVFAMAEAYLFDYSSRALVVAGYAGTTLVLAFYLLADPSGARGVVYALVPRGYHMRLARIFQHLEVIVGGYMRGQLITCASIGVFTLLLLTICRVPNALALALFAAIVDVIPFIGGLLVIVPAVASALPGGWPIAATVCGVLLLYMEFESRVLVPRVYGTALRLPRTAVVLALIAGGTLMGFLGALLALPITSALLMIVQELRVDLPGDDSDDAVSRAREARTDATYERMSAGATAPEAGEIAQQLADDSRAPESPGV